MPLLRRALVLLTALVAFCALTITPASASDAYPWKYDTTRSADPWGFTKRQCVSYVAWRMAVRGTPISNYLGRWGSAYNWDDNARRLGHGIGSRAVKGAIAHWNPGERAAWYANGSTRPNGWITAGPYGHVGYVDGVHADGSAVVRQYNMSGARSYSIVRIKAPRYLYVKMAVPR